MAHFAELDENNVVLRVVVVNDDYEADGENWCRQFFGTDNWKQTSYNTIANVHHGGDPYGPDSGIAFRKNYAGEGYTYDPTLDGFIPPKPFNSWTLDEDICCWEAPVPKPEGLHIWNEEATSWAEVED